MRTRLALPIAAVLAVFVGGMTAYASNNATWHSTFSVAFATSLVNNTADFNFGGVAVGVLSGSPIDDLTITSNDPAGVQLTVAAPSATITESGAAPCVPVPTRTVPASTSQMTGSATTGGTGGVAGTAAPMIIISTTAANIFSTVPTNTGTLDEKVTLNILPPTGTLPNSVGCSYTLTYNYVLIAQ